MEAPLVRVRELDALRGVGALMILLFHLWPNTVFFGWSRVDFFFVLSGFLVTAMILKYGQTRGFLGVFYMRRIFRTWPAYFILLACCVVSAVATSSLFAWDELWHYLFFLQPLDPFCNSHSLCLQQGLEHTWCLAVEEQFYLFWPAIVLLIGRRWVVPTAIWFLIISVTVRALGQHPWTLPARCDGFALGAILAAMVPPNVKSQGSRVRPHVFFGALMAIAMGWLISRLGTKPNTLHAFDRPLNPADALTILAVNLIYFAALGLILCHAGHWALGLLRSRILCYLGQISYGVFLFHALIITGLRHITASVDRQATNHGFPALPDFGILVICVLCGALSWHLVEKPLLKYRDRWSYQQ